MQDIYCRTCGEPWEVDYLHDVAEEQGRTFRQVYAAFRSDGCAALHASHGDANLAEDEGIADVIYELLGDDVDGAAATFEDWYGSRR